MLTQKERREMENRKPKKRPQTAHQIAWQRMQRRLEELGVRDMTPYERPQPTNPPEIPGRKSVEQLAREVGHLSPHDRAD